MKKLIKLLTPTIGATIVASVAPLTVASCSNTVKQEEKVKEPTVATAKLNLDASPKNVDLQDQFTPVTLVNNSDHLVYISFYYTGEYLPQGFNTFRVRYGQGDTWTTDWAPLGYDNIPVYPKMSMQLICVWDSEYVGEFSTKDAKFQLKLTNVGDDYITIGGSLLSLLSTFDSGTQSYKAAIELKSEYTFSELFSLNTNVKFNISSNFLPFKKLTAHCYDALFNGCTELLTAPALPAETLAEGCYKDMFNGCTKLKSTGNLPAITLANQCYQNMFYNCQNLNLISLAYVGNFQETYFKDWVKGAGTSSYSGIIRYNGLDVNEKSNFGIPSNFHVIQDNELILNHTKDVEIRDDGYSSVITGTKPKVRLYKDQNLTFGQIKDQIATYEAKIAGIPFKQWVKEDTTTKIELDDNTQVADIPSIIVPQYGEDESKRVFASHCTLVIDTDCSVNLKEYKGDSETSEGSNIWYLESADGTTWDETKWVKMTPNNKTYKWKKGYSYALKGNSQTTDPLHTYTKISITGTTNSRGVYTEGKCRLGGNIMSLALVDGKIPDPKKLTKPACFSQMFAGSTAITTVDDNFLPATELTEFCYASMFNGCTNLAKAPRLPATKAAGACYHWMFAGCTSLQTVPQLALEELVDPVWPIGNQESKNGVCDHMFSGCTKLVNVPDLKPTKLTDRAYNYMFSGCTSLTKVPKIYATEFTDGQYWGCYGVPEQTKDYPDIGGSCNGMFLGCTSIKDASDIWANETKTCPESKVGCFNQMFSGCTQLVKPPKLSDTLSKYCYYQMFYNCSQLKAFTGEPEELAGHKLFASGAELPEYATTAMFYGTNNYGRGITEQVAINTTYYCGYKEQ